MKAIKNVNELVDIFNGEDVNWQERIYRETGVFVFFDRGDGTLLSNCGYIDLDFDVDDDPNVEDSNENRLIVSVQDLIDYIHKMESYHHFLVDMSFGQFSKSELFWAVRNQIILAKENQNREDGSIYQDWDIFRISIETRAIPPYNERKEDEVIVLDIALRDYDETEIWIPRREDLKLSDALLIVTTQMNELTENIEDIPIYSVHSNHQVDIPDSFEKLKRLILPCGCFVGLE